MKKYVMMLLCLGVILLPLMAGAQDEEIFSEEDMFDDFDQDSFEGFQDAEDVENFMFGRIIAWSQAIRLPLRHHEMSIIIQHIQSIHR